MWYDQPIVTGLDFLLSLESSEITEDLDMTTDSLFQYELFTDWTNLEVLDHYEISVDTETTGLDPFEHRLRLVQVYLPKVAQVAIVDLWDLSADQFIWFNKFLDILSNNKVTKYFQNALFDCLWFKVKFGITIRNIADSMVLSQIEKAGQYDAYLFEALIASPNSLEWLSQQFGYKHDKQYQSSDWSNPCLSKEQISYSGRDAVITYLVGKQLYDHLSLFHPDTVEAELGALSAFNELNFQCLPVGNKKHLEDLHRVYKKAANLMEERLNKLMPEDPNQARKIKEYEKNPIIGKSGKPIKVPKPKPFNVASPSQIKEYLIMKFGKDAVEVIDNKTGKVSESTGKEVLFELYTNYPTARELKDIIYYRGVSKAASTLESYLNSYDEDRKCLKVAYQSLATQGMGRSSSGNKRRRDIQNAQNFSKYLPSHSTLNLPPIRSFVSARHGYKLLEVDLAASHLQFARMLSQDSSLQSAKDSGIKVHYYTLASMLKFEGLDVTPNDCIDLVKGKSDPSKKDHYEHLYKLAKTVIYSFLNYSGASRLQSTFFGYEIFVTVDDCRNYLQACADQYSGLRSFQDQVYNDASKTIDIVYVINQVTGEQLSLGKLGYSVTCDGSKVYHRCKPIQNKKGQWTHKLNISDVVSVQWMRPEGTVMKKSLADIHDLCVDEWGLDNARLVNFSHDSIMLEIREEIIHTVAPVCCDIITNNMRVYIPDYEPEETWQEQILKYNWAKFNWEGFDSNLMKLIG